MIEDSILIRVPKESGYDFRVHWSELRLVEGITSEHELGDSDEISQFDGATLAEWIIPLSEAITPILTCVLGFVVARRGEIEINGMKFKNVTSKQVKEILEVIEAHETTKSKDTTMAPREDPAE